jgi:hypothetical protein
LKGEARRDFLDWCADASQAYRQDYESYWDRDRTCYARAAERQLTGDARRSFLRDCLSEYRTSRK